MAEVSLIDMLAKPAAAQDNSPLFQIPAEIRNLIYQYALADYPDPSAKKRYHESTCYTRPSYFAPRRSSIDLLLTCRLICSESWFLPFLLREHTHWLTQWDRAPPEYDYRRQVDRLSIQLRAIQGRCGGYPVVINRLKVFAQMYKVPAIANLLATPGLFPRSLTLTIRHTDWWYWERDNPLSFDAHWIDEFCRFLPKTVREVCIELESVERKKNQVDIIAEQMQEKWFFRTADGDTLYGDGQKRTSTWTGSSTWHGKRWDRDESEKGKINYYVRAVTFRPEHIIRQRGWAVSQTAITFSENSIYHPGQLSLAIPENIRGSPS